MSAMEVETTPAEETPQLDFEGMNEEEEQGELIESHLSRNYREVDQHKKVNVGYVCGGKFLLHFIVVVLLSPLHFSLTRTSLFSILQRLCRAQHHPCSGEDSLCQLWLQDHVQNPRASSYVFLFYFFAFLFRRAVLALC